jgi:hypothetical protein
MLARTLRREDLRVLFLEHRGVTAGFAQLFHFEPFEALALLEAHLEPAHRRDQNADADENHADLARQRIGRPRHRKARRAHHQQHQQVDQAISLYVSFHLKIAILTR